MSWNNKEEIETKCSSTVQQHAASRYNNMQQHGTTTRSSTVQQHAAARYNNMQQHGTTTCSSTVQEHAAARYNNMQQHGTTVKRKKVSVFDLPPRVFRSRKLLIKNLKLVTTNQYVTL